MAYDVGIAVGLVSVEAALVIIADRIKGVVLEALGLVLLGVFVHVDQNAGFDQVRDAEGCRQRDIERSGLGHGLQQHLLIDFAQRHLEVLDLDPGLRGELIADRLHIAERSGGLQDLQGQVLAGRQFLGGLGRAAMNVCQARGLGASRRHDEGRRERHSRGPHGGLLDEPPPVFVSDVLVIRHFFLPRIYPVIRFARNG
jgi:hypothetical protein